MYLRFIIAPLTALALWCSTTCADEVDLPALVAALDSDKFAAREAAQQAIVAHGLGVVENLLSQAPPEDATTHAVHQHVNAQLARVNATLERDIYTPLARGNSFEARYRGEQVRATLESLKANRIAEILAQYPAKLPPDQQERVSGYTGGFRDEGPWFDAEFHNDSNFTVTQILALVRTTHKDTGVVVQREVLFTEADKPIAKGETVHWAAEVGMKRTQRHNFFWDIVAVYGLPIEKPVVAPVDVEEEPRLMHLFLPHRR